VLRDTLRPGDAILVKASRGIALEWVVERLEEMEMDRGRPAEEIG